MKDNLSDFVLWGRLAVLDLGFVLPQVYNPAMAKGILQLLKPAQLPEELEWFLDDKTILSRYVGEEAFLHSRIYQKLVEILTIVFDGYVVNTYTFLPIDDELDDYYQRLRKKLMILEDKMMITNLRIVDFKPIHSLNGNFQYLIGLWHYAKVMYSQDQQRLFKHAPQMNLPDNLKLMFIQIDTLLQEHQTNKVRLLGGELNPHLASYAGIQFDITEATLKYQDSEWYTIQVNQKEMQFLRVLVDAKGKVIDYFTIARSLDLNIAHQNADKMEVARAVQFLKRDLGKRLSEAGMSNENVKRLLQSIQSIHGAGYKLQNLS